MIAPDVPHKSEVHEYMRNVESGEVVAGRWLKLAVRRHLTDLENAGDRGLYFDDDIASRAVQFFPLVLRHSIGEWDGKPFNLTPSQMFIVWVLFGWRRERDDCRRFSLAYITVARKWGKSEFAAGLALMLTAFDDPIEPAAEVYTAATKRDQAKIVFKQAKRMVDRSPAIKKRCKVLGTSIVYEPTDSVLQPICSDGKTADGFNLHAGILDELHAWTDRHQDFYDKMTSAGGSRRQSLVVIITTAGDDKSRIWQRVDTLGCRVLDAVESGEAIADNVFAFIARLDESDDPFDESVWAKANPNMPITPKIEYLRDQANQAEHDPIERNKFTRYHANCKTSSHEKAIMPQDWLACRSDDIPDLESLPCFGGFDLGRSNDFCGLALCWPLEDRSGNGRTVVKTWSFTCEERGSHLSSYQFGSYIEHGWLNVNPGDEVDYKSFMSKLLELHAMFNVVTWAYDPSFASPIAQSLFNEHGVPIAKTYQTPKNYNGPTRSFCKAVRDGRIIHDGNGCLDWQIGNLTVSRNNNDEWMPDKSHPENKIDAVVSLLMAYRESMFTESVPAPAIF